MATVPTYDAPQVRDEALPGARQQVDATPDMLSGNADRLLRQGAGLMDTGDKLNAAAIKMKHEEDMRAVQSATAAYQEAAQNFTLDAKDKRTGIAAAGLVQDFDKFHTDTVGKIANGLTNPQQKAAFATMAGRSRLATRHDLGGFEITEGRKAGDASFDAVIRNTVNAGAIAATDDAAMTQRDIAVNNVRAFAATRNLPPEQEQALRDKVLTDFHAQRIQQLIRKDPMHAQDYFEQNKGEIAGSQQAELGAFAEKATATSKGEAAAGTVWQSLGPQSSSDPVKLSDMEARVRTELKGNEPAIEHAIKGIRERAQAYKDQRKEEGIALEAGVNKLVLNGASGQALRSSPEFIALSTKDPEQARKIMDYIDNKALRNEQTAAARESRAYTAQVRAEHQLHTATLDTTLRVQDPNILAAMSRDQVVNLLPTLGAESTQNTLAKWDALHKDKGALAEAKIDNDQFKSFSVRAGLDPDSKDDTMKKRVVDLRDKVERIIGGEQQARKKLLTREEKDVILQKQIDNEVMQHNTFWFDKKVPAITLPKDAQGNAYVDVDGTKVTLSSIPSDFRTQAIASRKPKGLPVDEQTIAKLWLKNNAKPK
jgi:hypothetical protein